MPRYITNDTDSPIYVAGRLIPPFDGRHFEDHELPAERGPEVAEEAKEPTLDEQLQEIRAGTIKKIVPQLAGLTYEALDRMGALEQSDEEKGQRKGLLQAIEEEKLRRADEQLREEAAKQAAEALATAQDQLLRARVALINLPPGTPEADREAAAAAVEEAEAKVAALTSEDKE